MSTWKAGDHVTVVGLTALAQYSGMRGVIDEKRTGAGKYRVRLDNGVMIAVDSTNLREVDIFEYLADAPNQDTPLRKLITRWRACTKSGPTNDRGVYGRCIQELIQAMNEQGL